MALKRLTIDGYGQLELNNVAFRRDGRVEAQCALNETDFTDSPAENGMLFAVDRVNREIRKCENNEERPIALNYSAEHMYDERANGLKDFYLEPGTFYPRLGYLAVGDLFTTNCISYDDGAFATEDDFIAGLEAIETTPLYGAATEDGSILIATAKATYGPVLQVVEKTTMPDGQLAVKLQVIA